MKHETKEIALGKDKTAKLRYIPPKRISTEAQLVIQEIMLDLRVANIYPNKMQELESIRNVCRKGDMVSIRLPRVDLAIRDKSNSVCLFMIRQPYKNQSRYDKYKRTLLEWAAVMLADNPETDIHTCIAIPSNPDYPRPYSRWRIAGMLDMKYELKVAEEFWDFLDSNN